jgi:hypothetical protein
LSDDRSLWRFAAANVIALAVGWAAGFVLTYCLAAATSDRDVAVLALIGTGMGHATVVAAWLALGPTAIGIRLPVSLLLLGLGYFLLRHGFIGWLQADRNFPDYAVVLAGIAMAALVQFMLVQIPLWLCRGMYGLRMTAGGSTLGQLDARRRQLSLKQILATITAVALLLAGLRGLSDQISIANSGPDRWLRLCVVFGMIVGFDLLLSWLAMWGFLSSRNRWKRVALATGLAAAMTLVQNLIFAEVFGSRAMRLAIMWLNLPHYALVVAAFTATHAAGFSLEHSAPRRPTT